jgi:hypothetical protein
VSRASRFGDSCYASCFRDLCCAGFLCVVEKTYTTTPLHCASLASLPFMRTLLPDARFCAISFQGAVAAAFSVELDHQIYPGPMRRFQFFEFHDQEWFPASIRDQITDALQFGLNLSRAYAPIAPLLERAIAATGSRSIIDLCSGGGGPWLDLLPELRSGTPALSIQLTDKFPNLRAFQNVKAASENHISSLATPVDAMRVPRELTGFRTMFTSFHHFSPDDAQAILQDAVDAGQSIGIFEVTRRNPRTIALMFGWVLMLFVCTPWIRPFRWSRLLWTYVIPIIPAALLFDGIVSCLRTYRPQELRDITAKLSGPKYQWQAGEYSEGRRRMPITYLISWPTIPAGE